jgi:hypothetical protein
LGPECADHLLERSGTHTWRNDLGRKV